MPSLNELVLLLCFLGIMAPSIFFQVWMKRNARQNQKSIRAYRLLGAILIFLALFTGVFLLGRPAARVAEFLFCFSIFSFAFLYHDSGQTLPWPSPTPAPSRAPTPPSNRIALGKLGFLAIIFGISLFLTQFPYFSLVILFTYPYFTPHLIRLQYRSAVMIESELKQNLKAIFEKANTKLDEIFILDTEGTKRTPNAMMAKNTLFITLDLIKTLNESELEAVVCHEASHLKEKHLWKRLFCSLSLFLLVIFWFVLPTSLIFFKTPEIILLSMGLAFAVHSGLTQKIIFRQELEADLGAISLGAKKETLLSALYKLSSVKLISEQAPHWTSSWISRIFSGASHPNLAERELNIQSGALPKTAYFVLKKQAIAYSLFVFGIVFYFAYSLESRTMRSPATRTIEWAKSSG